MTRVPRLARLAAGAAVLVGLAALFGGATALRSQSRRQP